ncbi:unnamed protein product [Arabidopsis lyrata]|uniref:Subtilase family protein n=1 Tax=Arabidopsis lyrata subsp. lyrata TaxID=81972 RepID=D7MFJ1_ARALL|nr:subtilisin-like protease SBT2.2 isoform X1 [Arabidopsis lyrata subsp. lyrata]EFH44140.1 subtilase family protein [Arabidopsis lyrata subsp. lyrata]CAH8275941.1 unnamed protein product [Arabidopsis lyrata]|eukprot:XP_002867881.1 subtilisin-like protease SBT2.2 isoform X1 [Arabidopsis lyrata subsp. lyrata]
MMRVLMVNFGVFLLFCFGFLSNSFGQDNNAGDSDINSTTAVYIVTLRQAPSLHLFQQETEVKNRVRDKSKHGDTSKFTRPKLQPRNISKSRYWRSRRSAIAQAHDSLLRNALKGEKYIKLYSFHYLINGFAVFVSSQQAEKLSRRGEVANIVLDFSVRTATTYTPQFMGLPKGAWVKEGGFETAGEGIVIGFIDTGIDPTHPSFNGTDTSQRQYPIPNHFSGVCEVTPDFPSGSCNRKLVGARHFAQSAITRGIFNSSEDYASPFDGDGHGTHTASIAAGNHGVSAVVSGHNFGSASGIAPRAHISVYKALYKSFGGFAADVVAAIDQAAQDGVDILSLSITPNRRPPGVATFFNPLDMAMLSAVKAGIFVVQAAGNTGPSPKSMSSFSPWIFTVGAATHDRVYSNSIILGNNVSIPGIGLALPTDEGKVYTMISALDALKNKSLVLDKDMYVGECQDYDSFDKDIIRGNLLICSYSIRFVLGLSTIKQALAVTKNLSAKGVVFYMDPYVLGFQINPTPMDMPGIIIPSSEDSKVLLKYYNSSLVRDGTTKEIVRFGAVAAIAGGQNANFSNRAPKIMYYSARGPDPEDSLFNDADILKPNLVAPGNSIWGAWSSAATESTEFEGESFAMMSGTSMAAPHVAGVAALVKQKFRKFSPSSIASALSTTSVLFDNKGEAIMAQRAYANPDQTLSPATPFDMGNGFVNATAALDPGLIFDTSFEDYMSFLCGINGSAPVVFNYTGKNCLLSNATISGADLNLPSITVSRLNNTRTIQRLMTNIAGNETYTVSLIPPFDVLVKVSPTQFSIASGETKLLSVILTAKKNSSIASFGRVKLFGTAGHVVHIPMSVTVKIASNQ